jgi:formate hydrogenlyase subunit 6/NADH:ubiquinone oxidoreductase subunit I/ferredoxin
MSDPVTLTIDGREVSATSGSTILAACTRLGIDTPTLCWGQTLIPQNACRVCVVELEGSRVLVPACQRPVEAGMRIQTDSDRVRHARKLVLEFLGSSVDVSTAPALQAYLRRYGGQPERFAGGRTVAAPPKLDNEAYVRDYGKCILCYKCVQACGAEWQNTFAIAVAGRGFDARIATEYETPLPDSACVYCGNCIAVCPTGALVGKVEYDLRQAARWNEAEQTRTDTVCPYCGVGCLLTLHVQDNRIVKVTSPFDHDVTRGNLCVKGRFGWAYVHAVDESASAPAGDPPPAGCRRGHPPDRPGGRSRDQRAGPASLTSRPSSSRKIARASCLRRGRRPASSAYRTGGSIHTRRARPVTRFTASSAATPKVLARLARLARSSRRRMPSPSDRSRAAVVRVPRASAETSASARQGALRTR